jgi:hypothetical protein
MNVICLVLDHADVRVHEPGRVYLHCQRCGRDTPGWGPAVSGWSDDLVPPQKLHVGPLTFRELCHARKHGIEPVVLPKWATSRIKHKRSA